MIIKAMLDELFTQIKEVSCFENMEIYKVINNEHGSMYHRYSENKSNDLLEKLDNKISWNDVISKTINTQQTILSENRSYGSDDLKNVSSYTIPIVFRNEAVFLINMVSFNNSISFTKEQRREIDDIVFSFEEFFCLREMINIDMIRDRSSLAF